MAVLPSDRTANNSAVEHLSDHNVLAEFNNDHSTDPAAHSGTYVAYVTGLTGDGVTNNTAVLQAAIDAANTAGGGIVQLPEGSFAHTGLTMKDLVELRGVGKSTILLNTHASNASITAIGTVSPYRERWAIKDLALSAATIRSGQYGLSISLARRFHVSNLWVENHDHGIHDSTTWQSTWQDVTCINNNYGWYVAAAPPGSGAGNPSTRHGVLLKTNSQYGLYVENHINMASFFGGGIEGNLAGGAKILGDSAWGIKFDSVNFEDNVGTDVEVGDTSPTAPSQIQFSNCYFHRASLVAGSKALRLVRGTRVATIGCRFDNYEACVNYTTSFGGSLHLMPSTSGSTDWVTVDTRPDLTVTGAPVIMQGDATTSGLRLSGNSLFFSPAADTSIGRSAANVVGLGANDVFKTGQDTTGNRPVAATVGAGSLFYDMTLQAPIWSDGAVWRDAAPATNKLLRPTAVLAETIARNAPSASNLATLASGKETLQLIWLDAGITVTSITFMSWTTALAIGTNQWFSLRNLSRQLLGITSDATSGAWSAFSEKTLPLAVPYLVPTAGLYYVGIMVAATTPPSLAGASMGGAYSSRVPILQGYDNTNTGLTTPATAPATSAALTAATAGGTILTYIT